MQATWLSQFLQIFEWILLAPAVGGSVYAILCLLAVMRFRKRRPDRKLSIPELPPVTILKPVCGLEKNIYENLRSACVQDYPEFQVVFSTQAPDDPAIPLLRHLREEFGSERVTVAVEDQQVGTNGKINNLAGGLIHARHEILVISDSDVRLEPDYLRAIVPPLADPEVGCVCTFYKAACAGTWYEKLELLTLNADFMANVLFAHVTGASKFCLGASTALRRSILERIGGLEALADYLVEDYEMGRRIWGLGKRVEIVPYVVETMVDLKSPAQWWNHQIYWDQNTRSARPFGFFATVVIRAVPFALLYALVRLGDAAGLSVLAGAVALRLFSAGIMLGWGLRDREGLKSLAFLPVRDILSIATWFLAFVKRTTSWRGSEFVLTRDGRLVAREAGP